MTYSAITSAEIVEGKPNTNSLWEKIRTNFDDLNDRIVVSKVFFDFFSHYPVPSRESAYLFNATGWQS